MGKTFLDGIDATGSKLGYFHKVYTGGASTRVKGGMIEVRSTHRWV